MCCISAGYSILETPDSSGAEPSQKTCPQGIKSVMDFNLTYYRCKDADAFAGMRAAYLFQGNDSALLTDLYRDWAYNTSPASINVDQLYLTNRLGINFSLTLGNIASNSDTAQEFQASAWNDFCVQSQPGDWGKSTNSTPPAACPSGTYIPGDPGSDQEPGLPGLDPLPTSTSLSNPGFTPGPGLGVTSS